VGKWDVAAESCVLGFWVVGVRESIVVVVSSQLCLTHGPRRRASRISVDVDAIA